MSLNIVTVTLNLGKYLDILMHSLKWIARLMSICSLLDECHFVLSFFELVCKLNIEKSSYN